MKKKITSEKTKYLLQMHKKKKELRKVNKLNLNATEGEAPPAVGRIEEVGAEARERWEWELGIKGWDGNFRVVWDSDSMESGITKHNQRGREVFLSSKSKYILGTQFPVHKIIHYSLI